MQVHVEQGVIAQKHKGVTLSILLLGAFVAILNQTLLNVAIPHLMNEFHVSADTVQWLSTGYLLVNGILIPLSAFIIGSLTTRQLFFTAMSLFLTGSVICGFAPSFPVMMLGRIVQAAGAGVLMPFMMTVILFLYPPEVRGKAMGTIGIAMFFAPAIGPTLSGWIVETWTWRLLFYIVIPIALIDMILGYAYLKNVTVRTKPPFDAAGCITSIIAFGSLLYGFSEAGSKGWNHPSVIVFLLTGVVFLLLFIWIELHHKAPLLNLRVFSYDMFTLTTLVSCIVNMAMFGAMLLLPIYLQNLRGFTPLQSGLLMLPGSILMGVMSPIAGSLFDRYGARPLAIIGLLITTLTTWEFSQLNMDTSYSKMMWLYTLRTLGMSFITMTIMTAGLNQLPRDLGSHGTAAANTARQVAASIGTAFLVTTMTNRSQLHWFQWADRISASNPYIVQTLLAAQQGGGLSNSPSADAASSYFLILNGLVTQQSAVEGMDDSFMVATLLTIVALLFSFFLRRVKPQRSE